MDGWTGGWTAGRTEYFLSQLNTTLLWSDAYRNSLRVITVLRLNVYELTHRENIYFIANAEVVIDAFEIELRELWATHYYKRKNRQDVKSELCRMNYRSIHFFRMFSIVKSHFFRIFPIIKFKFSFYILFHKYI